MYQWRSSARGERLRFTEASPTHNEGKKVCYPGLNPLRDVLADLYSSEGIARVIVLEAGLPR